MRTLFLTCFAGSLFILSGCQKDVTDDILDQNSTDSVFLIKKLVIIPYSQFNIEKITQELDYSNLPQKISVGITDSINNDIPIVFKEVFEYDTKNRLVSFFFQSSLLHTKINV